MTRARILHTLCKPEILCLCCALIFGPLLALLTPPLQSPDEGAHLFRLWQLSRGGWVAQNFGGVIPTSLIEFNATNQPLWLHNHRTNFDPIRQDLHQPLDPTRTQFLPFASAALYSPLPYAPQTIGVLIGRLLNAPPVILMYLGRLANALAYALLAWAIIRLTPILKWTTCILLLSPLPLFLAGTLSADPLTIEFCLLTTALLLRLILATGSINWRSIAATALSAAAAGLCKSVYVPIAALAFAIPAPTITPRWRRWIAPLIILAAAILATAIWSALSHPMDTRQRGGPPADQLIWITHHPLAYALTCIRTIRRDGVPIVISIIGVLGWLDTPIGLSYTAIYFLLMLWTTLNDPAPPDVPASPKRNARVLSAAAALISTAAIFTSVYMLWEKPGEPYVDGIQGRYFLPLALLAAIILHRHGRSSISPPTLALLLLLGCAHTAWIVLLHYYVL